MPDLPKCLYPKAHDSDQHGLQQLPDRLIVLNLHKAERYSSSRFEPVLMSGCTPCEILETIKIVSSSFVLREPMNRHLCPPVLKPDFIKDIQHADALGTQDFGEWTKENIFHWFIRLQLLTFPNSRDGVYRIDEDILKLSLVIKNSLEQIIGGAFNMTLSPSENDQADNEKAHPFVNAISPFIDPPFQLIMEQEHEAIGALIEKYKEFKKAYQSGRVAAHFLIARTDVLPTEDTFQLVLSSAIHFKKLKYKFMVITATNNWTGAACEVLNGVRVHYTPYRDRKRVAESANAKETEAFSSDGFISDKDSGAMFYLIKLE